MNPSLNAHEAQVQRFYDADPEKFLRIQSTPYRNWGYWATGATSIESACAAMIDRAIECAGIQEADQVLDVGCAFGAGTRHILDRTGCRSIVGIDISSPNIAHARRQYAGAEDGRISFEEMSATRMTFPDGAFSRVVAVDCASHFSSRDLFFREAHRVLRPGGRLVILDVSEGRSSLHPYYRLVKAVLMRYWRLPAENRYGPEAYRRKVEAAGFQGVEVRSLSEDVFPGAFRFLLGEEYTRRVRDIYGPVTFCIWSAVMHLIRALARRRDIEFLQLTARR